MSHTYHHSLKWGNAPKDYGRLAALLRAYADTVMRRAKITDTHEASPRDIDRIADARDAAEAQVERLRPVVEAAQATENLCRLERDRYGELMPPCECRICRAVRAYQERTDAK